MSYSGWTVMVTGASRGLGAAYAAELARRGARLVLVARSRSGLDALAAGLRDESDATVHVISADLASRAGLDAVIADLVANRIEIDLLLNNAGVGGAGPFLGAAVEREQRTVDVNIAALLHLTSALLPPMIARRRGGLIVVGSTAAFQPLAYQAVYAASKAFALSFTEALAEEVAGSGVRVMAAHPGATATGFFDDSTHEMDPRATDSPERVAARTLDDFARGRAASYPGRPSTRAMTWASRVFPRTVVARIAAGMNRRAGMADAVAL